MEGDALSVLRAVSRGPCHELDSRPFLILQAAKKLGLIEPHRKSVILHYGPSTHWTLSPTGREELRRLEATTANSVGTERSGVNQKDRP